MADENIEKPDPPAAEPAEPADTAVEEKAEPNALANPPSVPPVPTVAKQVDRAILRFNKLISSPGGLNAFLSTFNYTLYIAAYVQLKSPSLAAFARNILGLLRKSTEKSSTSILVDGGIPPLVKLAALVSKTRTVLRLFGLFPLYAWLRTLVVGRKSDADPVLHRIALVQASSYFVYQALENVSLLADEGVVPRSLIARINRGDSATARVYLWAYRFWLGGVSCDFLRLAREAQLQNRRRAVRARMSEEGRELAVNQEEEDRKIDVKWWTELVIASAWFPMAFHYSSSTGGIPGWNLGWMGLCGLVAGSSRASGLWSATLQS